MFNFVIFVAIKQGLQIFSPSLISVVGPGIIKIRIAKRVIYLIFFPGSAAQKH